MKKIILSLLFIAVFTASHADVVVNALITATIKNNITPKAYLLKELAFTLSGWTTIDSATIDANGILFMKLNLSAPLVCALNVSGKTLRMFMVPGDSVHVEMDLNVWPSSIKFSGKGGNENTFYFNFRQNYTAPIPNNKLYGSRPGYYNYLCDSLYSVTANAYISFFKDQPAEKNFEEFLSQKAMYLAASRKMMFPVYQRFVKRDDSLEARVDTAYYSFLRKTPFDNPVAYYTDTYSDFLYWYYKERVYEVLNNVKLFEDDESILGKQFDITAGELKGYPKEIALARIITKMVDKNYITNAGKMIDYMKANGTSAETMNWLNNMYEKFAHLAMGATPPEIMLPDSTGKLISLSSLKGKIVYVDFWASWCGPCRGEMPYSKQLIETFKDKPVTFLFISIDEDKKRWLQALSKEKLNGVHVIDQKGWSSSLCDHYNFHSIPHYAIIDADGKMFTPDAKRPSSGAYDQINYLLNQKK